jgi:lipopolysaccharide heptosyltransferase II
MNRNVEPRRILAVNLNYLGDALFTTPALGALRERYPAATLDVLAGARAGAVLSGDPAISRLLLRPPHGGLGRAEALLRALRAGDYDAVVFFQSTLANALLAWAVRVPVRVGFVQEGCAAFLTHPVPARRPGEHAVSAYLRLAEALSARGESRLRLHLGSEDRDFAEHFLRDQELPPPVVGLVIGATRPQKRWPEAYFARLAERLWSAAGVSCVLLGGAEEAEAAARILEASRAPLVSAIGRTSEKQLAALIDRLAVVVSGDSGPLHIATAVGTPVVGLFGSTDPEETGPWQPGQAVVLYDRLPCAPCRKHPTCGGRFDCLHALTPERVFEATVQLLGVSPRRTPLPVIATAPAAAPREAPL